MDKYAGYLYCAECGSRLYLNRGEIPRNNSFRCGRYESRKSDCTSHYIREELLDEIVLTSLKKVTSFARENSNDFYKMAMENGEIEAKKLFKETEIRRSEYESKIKQFDNEISILYMDRVTGRITPERYDILAAGYEKEQASLKLKLQELDSQMSNMDMREKCVSDFIRKAKHYLDMSKLTPELLRAFIRRIEVYEKPEKYSRTCGNHIIIYFTFQPDHDVKIEGTTSELDTTAFAE